ncbi:hypothetical protein PNH38_03480 [Anoxybacillus rupiensis]|uniref:Uncharacterized protein n=2 Tax=Bacillales TaxID=1385 RepID=A0ABD5IS90_9BACL|nr:MULTISPECIES: hypothetical protein [Anoxybacillus]KXG11609.1 hypothetical protein AT864_00693 [Anoxybacillus sp. P3H1B]MBB3907060.1 hypothetical protein [Anoxybacillus rupiensis]MBS2771412.1 hypothetical protein [Anoxybacillus rupiensis]MDE8562942.1 hypothetical protein [Anoxybacillus rupiensis]MED5051153.1 hypothetical protein [Anoxybacillus rupiensis]
MEDKKKNNEWNLYDDEEVAQEISEQIMSAYHSDGIEQEQPHYQPQREIGE